MVAGSVVIELTRKVYVVEAGPMCNLQEAVPGSSVNMCRIISPFFGYSMRFLAAPQESARPLKKEVRVKGVMT